MELSREPNRFGLEAWAANPQPKSQKLPCRIRATSHDRDFSQEDQKDRRPEMGGRASAGGRVLRGAPNGAANQTF
jgi:hypothetical protein